MSRTSQAQTQSSVKALCRALVGLQGCAVKAGMLIGRGQHLLMADADGATRIQDLEKLEAALRDLDNPGKPHKFCMAVCNWLSCRRGCLLMLQALLVPEAGVSAC